MDESKIILDIINKLTQKNDCIQTKGKYLLEIKTIMNTSKENKLNNIINLLIKNSVITLIIENLPGESDNNSDSNNELIKYITPIASEFFLFFISKLLKFSDSFYLFIQENSGIATMMKFIRFVSQSEDSFSSINYSLQAFYLVLKELFIRSDDKGFPIGNFIFVSLLESFKSAHLILSTIHFIYDIIAIPEVLKKINIQEATEVEKTPLFNLISHLYQVMERIEDDEVIYQCLRIFKYILGTCENSNKYIKEFDFLEIAFKYKGKNKKQMEIIIGNILNNLINVVEIIDIITSDDLSKLEINSAYLNQEIKKCKDDINKLKGNLLYVVYLLYNFNKEDFCAQIYRLDFREYLLHLMNNKELIDSIVIPNNLEYYIFELICSMYNYIRYSWIKRPSESKDEFTFMRKKSYSVLSRALETFVIPKLSPNKAEINEKELKDYLKILFGSGFDYFKDNEDVIKLICSFIGNLELKAINGLLSDKDSNSIESLILLFIEKYYDKHELYSMLNKIQFTSIYKEKKEDDIIYSDDNYLLLIFRFSMHYNKLKVINSAMMDKLIEFCNEDYIEKIILSKEKNIKQIKYLISLVFAPIFNNCLLFEDNSIKFTPLITLLSCIANLFENDLKELENSNILSMISSNILFVINNNNNCSDLLIKNEEIIDFINACFKVSKNELNNRIYQILDKILHNSSLLNIYISLKGINYFIFSLSNGFEVNEYIQNIFKRLSHFIKDNPKEEYIVYLPELIKILKAINITNNIELYYFTLDFIHIIFKIITKEENELYIIANDTNFPSHLVYSLTTLFKQESTFFLSNIKLEPREIFLNKILLLLVQLGRKEKCLNKILNNSFFTFIISLLTIGPEKDLNISIKLICTILICGLKSNNIERLLYLSKDFHEIISLIKIFLLNNKNFKQKDLLEIYELFDEIIKIECNEEDNENKLITDAFLKDISIKYIVEEINDENKEEQKLNKAIKKSIKQSLNIITNAHFGFTLSPSKAFKENNKDYYPPILKSILLFSEPIQLNQRRNLNIKTSLNIPSEKIKKRSNSLTTHSQFKMYYIIQLIYSLRKKIKNIKIKASISLIEEDELNDLSNILYFIYLLIKQKDANLYIGKLIDTLFILFNNNIFTSSIQIDAFLILNDLLINSKDDFIHIMKNDEEKIKFCIDQYNSLINNFKSVISLYGKTKTFVFTNIMKELIQDKKFFNKYNNSLKITEAIKALNFLANQPDIVINILDILKNLLHSSQSKEEEINEQLEPMLMGHIWKNSENSPNILYALLSFIQDCHQNELLMDQFLNSPTKDFYSFFKSTIQDSIFRKQNLSKVCSFLKCMTVYPKYIRLIIDTSNTEILNFIKNSITYNDIMNDILDFLNVIAHYPDDFINFLTEKNFNENSLFLLIKFGSNGPLYNGKFIIKIIKFQLMLIKDDVNKLFFSRNENLTKLINVLIDSKDISEFVQIFIELILNLFQGEFKELIVGQENNMNELKEIVICLISKSIQKENSQLLSNLCLMMQTLCEVTDSLEFNKSFIVILSSNLTDRICTNSQIMEILLNSILFDICLNKRIFLTTTELILEILKRIMQLMEEKKENISVGNLILSIVEIIVSESSDIWKEYTGNILTILSNFTNRSSYFKKVDIIERITAILTPLVKSKVKEIAIQTIFLSIIKFIRIQMKGGEKLKNLLDSIKYLSSYIQIENNEDIKDSYVSSLYELFSVSVEINTSSRNEVIKSVVDIIFNLCRENEYLTNQFRNQEPKLLYLTMKKTLGKEGILEDKELEKKMREVLDLIDEKNLLIPPVVKKKISYSEKMINFLTTKQEIKVYLTEDSCKCFFKVDEEINNIYLFNENLEILRQISFDEIDHIAAGTDHFKKRTGIFSSGKI